jgi:hypothetical protein
MARRVFFSFHYEEDAWKAGIIRNSAQVYETKGFHDNVDWESIKRQGDSAIKKWIDNQLLGCSVTIVLIGAGTAERQWVKYEIQESRRQGMGLIGIQMTGMSERRGQQNISQIRDGANPFSVLGFNNVKIHKWINGTSDNRLLLPQWIEAAAREASR